MRTGKPPKCWTLSPATGLLLKQDKQAFNVVRCSPAKTLRSSWWSHPRGRLIFAVLSELDGPP